jgi:hypothetical protein
MEQLDYNLLYRWFAGLGVDEPVWVPTVFTKNRERLLEVELAHKFPSRTLGADKAYDVRKFVDDLRDLNVTPHIAQNTSNRTSAIDARTTRHPGYAISQRQRKRTEEPFGWAKTIGGLARPMLRGVARFRFKFTLTMAAYDLTVAQLARLARMTSRRLSKMESTPAKQDLTRSLSPWATAGHHAPLARISVAR